MAARVTVTRNDLETFAREVERLVRGEDPYGTMAKWALDISMDQFGESVERLVPVASGKTVQGIRVRVAGRPFRGLLGEVYNPLAHWRYVEGGRGPGKMPPVLAIAKWIRWRGIIAAPHTQGFVAARGGRKWRRPGNTEGAYTPAELDLARRIAVLIAARGTHGARMVQRGYQDAKPVVIQNWFSYLDFVAGRLASHARQIGQGGTP